MKYFLISQDRRYNRTPELLGLFHILDKRDINRRDAHRIPDGMIVYARFREEYDFPDILDGDMLLVSDAAGRVLSFYREDIPFKDVVLIGEKRDFQISYRLPVFEDVDCLHPDSVYGSYKTLEEPVLDRKKITGKSIFRIEGMDRPNTAVRLDVAESLLRRGLRGFVFTEAKLK
jgi:hypothetical protein